jgi:hypothetical protein
LAADMYMELNDESLIELEAPSTARLDKAIPGSKWSASRSLWILPLSWASCTVARAELGQYLEVGERLTAWATEEYESRVLPAAVARESEDGPGFTPAAPGDPEDVIERETVEGFEKESRAVDSAEKAESAWWYDIWRGMPEFLHKDLSAKRTLLINFRNVEDFEEFAHKIGQRIGPRERSVWYPEAPIERETDWLWTDEDQPVTDGPQFPSQVQRLAKEQGDSKSVLRRKAAVAGTDPLAEVLKGLV